MQTIHERVDTLEDVLRQFIINTDRLADEMREFKDEMRLYRERSEKEMREFKNEMLEFKDEMKGFKEQQDEEWKKWRREWSNISKKMGTIVEDLVAPALKPVLEKYFKCDVRMEGERQLRRLNGGNYEIDAMAVCDDKVFMVEVRSTPRIGYVDDIVEKKGKFFDFFPEHRGKELIVIFGGITFTDDIIQHASKKKIYVMAWREWEYMDILNFDEVQR